MKRGLLLLLLLLPSVLADYYGAEELVLDVSIENSMEVIPTRGDYALKRATVYLSFFPKEDFRQYIEYTETEPEHQKVDDSYMFEWINPDDDELEFTVNSRLTTYNELTKINKKIDFPIKDLSSELKGYIIETPTIDYTDPTT